MIAIAKDKTNDVVPAWHKDFLTMLPAIRQHAWLAFRNLKPDAREEAVQEVICNALVARARSEKIMELRVAKKCSDGKQIQPLSMGLVLVYPLTGLVRCAKCGAAMRPSRSGAKSKDANCYFYYHCPSANDGRCDNKLYLRGPWLWEAVVARLREVLFPLGESTNGERPDWLPALIAEVKDDLGQRLEQDQHQRPMLEQEIKSIEGKVAGWTETLSKTDLSSLVRAQIEQQLGAALERKQAIDVELEVLAAGPEQLDVVLDPKAAIDRLVRLHEVLASGSASDVNVELWLHIDSILVDSDGTVVMRTNRLGIFEGIAQILAGDNEECRIIDDDDGSEFRIRPRALTRRRTAGSTETSHLAKVDGLIEGHVDLPEKWVDEAIFKMPKLISWAEEHADEVAVQRKRGRTMEQLAEYFGRTVPTIRSALRHAAKKDPSLLLLPKKMPRACWAKDHASEAAAMKAQGMSTVAIARHFGKSDTTIRQALSPANQADYAGGDSQHGGAVTDDGATA